MKKIVALVLSLVMVLGLATTAMAATSYTNLTLKDTDAVAAVTNNVTLTAVKAVAPTYNKVTGAVEAPGAIAYLVDGSAQKYVQVATLAEADCVAYVDTTCKIVKFYLDKITDETYYEGVAFANFGEDCGEYTYDPVDGAAYYTIKGDLNKYVYETDVLGTVNLMVGGKLVTVDATAVATTPVAHTVVTETEDGAIVNAYCSACKMQAVKVANYASLPVGAVIAAGPDATGAYWYFGAAQAPAADDTVESAKTFDAGIAMYVGMSVMAAAGSAVVLKKKD